MTTVVDTTTTQLAPIPLRGLPGRRPVSFPLYLETGRGRFVLYQPGDREFDASHEDRLIAEGVSHLFIREEDRQGYSRRIEGELDAVLKDRDLSVENRAAILTGVAVEVSRDIFAAMPDAVEIRRARRVMGSTASLVIREESAFVAIREVLGRGTELAEHSLAVAMLSVGLAHKVIGRDSAVLMRAGLAGLLHDVGRVDQNPDEADPEHTVRGYQLLKKLGLSAEVCDTALFHHERFDGSGFPEGKVGGATPQMARIVGLVNTFHRVYSESEEQTNVFNALRVVAQVYQGCFDPNIASAFVRMFGG